MKKTAESVALLDKLLAEFESWIGDIRGQSSLVTAAFVDAQPEESSVPVADTATPRSRPVMLIKIPSGARKRLSTAERKETVMPADSQDPVVRGLLTGLNRYHLWLMADAAGAVSEYYRSLYALLGYLDPETWPCSSFGDLRMSEVEKKPLEWFEERAAAFVESRGMVGVADALTSVMPTLKHSSEVKTPPGVWFRGSDLLLKMILECHGSLPKATMDEWFSGAGMEASEALRMLDVLSYISTSDVDATLWLIDVSPGSEPALKKRFDLLLGKAQSCVQAGHAAAREYFGCNVVGGLPQPVPEVTPHRIATPHIKIPQQPAASVLKTDVPEGKDPSFVPIKLQEPARRFVSLKTKR